ncbi:hypothetical protein [Deinococcus maricopensis]|uniref:Uncharacterized protein n=1 Tax=Deinococcus maricopensis (strain DSM 21211 / LMG 22137 / NRRL B-23946 / LB-34) TaxID=709986 RepID=E8U7T0_DEIML|nr:hypothetical protein [Deinococcus maricopensis]ADV67119.1 hypothetical protein Deima_1470 [Deinococcus maricopensis DSM 21211]
MRSPLHAVPPAALVQGLALLLAPLVLLSFPRVGWDAATPIALTGVVFDLTFSALIAAHLTRRRFPARYAERALLGLTVAALIVPGGWPFAVLPGGAWTALRARRQPTIPLPQPMTAAEELQVRLHRWLGHTGTARTLAREALTLASFRARPHVPGGAVPFTAHQRGGWGTYVVLYVFMDLPTHFALHATGLGAFAWAVTGAQGLTCVWAAALAASVRAHPTLVTGEHLLLQQGLLWTARVPRAHVQRVTPYDRHAPGLGLSLLVPPNVTVQLTEPVTVQGVLGLHRRTRTVHLFLDDPAAFTATLQDAGAYREA